MDASATRYSVKEWEDLLSETLKEAQLVLG